MSLKREFAAIAVVYMYAGSLHILSVSLLFTIAALREEVWGVGAHVKNQQTISRTLLCKAPGGERPQSDGWMPPGH